MVVGKGGTVGDCHGNRARTVHCTVIQLTTRNMSAQRHAMRTVQSAQAYYIVWADMFIILYCTNTLLISISSWLFRKKAKHSLRRVVFSLIFYQMLFYYYLHWCSSLNIRYTLCNWLFVLYSIYTGWSGILCPVWTGICIYCALGWSDFFTFKIRLIQ